MDKKNIRFTLNGEWVEASGQVRKVGLSAQNARELGEVTYVGEVCSGKAVRRGEPLMSLEASKAAFDVYAPLDGTIRGCNPKILADPGLITRDPYGEGWLLELEISDVDESQLMEEEAYLQGKSSS